MKTASKFFLAAFAALTLVSGAAQASDNHLRDGGPGVVISQGNVLTAQVAHASQGR